jgi:hypothetical protein
VAENCDKTEWCPTDIGQLVYVALREVEEARRHGLLIGARFQVQPIAARDHKSLIHNLQNVQQKDKFGKLLEFN